jgi:two-component system, chemotaxis family, protein-glutamate methylesterase/glutaminase
MGIVVMGGSAGAQAPLATILSSLERDFPAPIAVVQHIPPHTPSMLATVLGRKSGLPVIQVAGPTPTKPGHVYVAPPNRHLIVTGDLLDLEMSARENWHRPAIDPLFRSAARDYGEGATGVILSGNLDDGTAGLAAIKAAGGTAIVQDPRDATHPWMPESAIAYSDPDHVAPSAEIGKLLARLVGEKKHLSVREPPRGLAAKLEERGAPTDITCPECGGVLAGSKMGRAEVFRCHVGHAFSPRSLSAGQAHAAESALWAALVVLKERVAVIRKLVDQADRQGNKSGAATLRSRAVDIEKQIDAIQCALPLTSDPTDVAVSESLGDQEASAAS